MAKFKSAEYVADSGSDSDAEENQFQLPKNFNKYTSQNKFPSEINNKEVWLIKVPKGFPIKKLSNLPVSFTSTSLENGPQKIKIDESLYQVNEELLNSADVTNNKYKVLVNNGKYIPFKSSIERFYNIRESIDIPEINYDKVVKNRKNVKKVTNLRMRHFPTGYSAHDYDEAKVQHEDDKDDQKIIKKQKTQESDINEKKDKKQKKDKKESKDKKERKKDKKEKEKEK